MDYRQIIAESWKYTQNNKKLIRWLGFFPALFTTTVAIGTILYQVFSIKETVWGSADEESFGYEVVKFIWNFIQNHVTWTVPLIVTAISVGIIYFIFPTLAKAAAIQVIARERNGQKVGVGTGLRYGFMSLLQLIEYHAIIKVFSFMFILFEMSFVFRNLGFDMFMILMPIFIVFLISGLVMTLLFTYADFYIVIDKESVFASMRKSARLVVMHWKHTFLITILMLIIGIRIVIQVVLVFLIPALIILITGYLSIILAPQISILIGGLIGAVALVIAAYLNGVVDVFSYTVWTHTFLNLSSEKELSARDNFTDDIGGNNLNVMQSNL